MSPMEKFKKEAPAILLIFIGVPLAFYLTGIGCPIKFLTGISCPGCGMSRAWASVASLDFAKAFAFHPLFLLGPAIPILLLVEPFIGKRACTIALAIIGCALVVCWVIRLLAFSDVGFGQPPFLESNVVSIEKPVWLVWLENAI